MEAREIKFRAWDTELKFMVEPISYIIRFDGIPFFDNKGDVIEQSKKLVLMQFTGLRDKNGKEIFEGDVVKIHNYNTEFKHKPSIDYRIFEIKWNRYTWAFNNTLVYMPLSDYDINTSEPYDIEKIGTIYENPELLK